MADLPQWPKELVPKSMTWGLDHNTKMFESAFNRSSQARTYPGARWVCTISFENMFRDTERRLTTFVHALNGRAGRFLLRDVTRPAPVSRGESVVDGDGQTGGILNTRGWLPDTKVLAAGDYITVQDEFKEVLEDVWSDAGGQATLRIAPWLRWSPPSGAEVNHTAPYAVMRLDDDLTELQRKPLVTSVSISCTEAI